MRVCWNGPMRRWGTPIVVSVAAILARPVSAVAMQQGAGAAPEVRDARASAVTLRGYDEVGLPTEQGSGFYLADGRIATTARVIAGADRIDVFDPDGEALGTIRRPDAVDSARDLAILPAPNAGDAVSAPGLTLREAPPEPGDPVWVYGSPHGLGGTMTTGIVSGLRDRDGRSVLQISAALSSGSSGGPVLDVDGKVIGVAVSRLATGQNLGFAVPAGDLAHLVRDDSRVVAEPPAPSDDAGWHVTSPRLQTGQQLRAAIGSRDYMHDGTPYDMYWFEGAAGQDIEIAVSSEELDPYVVLTRAEELNADTPWRITDDDSGPGTDALIATALPATGTYVVIVSSTGGSDGTYAVELRDRPLADRWEFVARNASDADLYFDRRTLHEANGLLRVWIYTQYGQAQGVGESSFDATKALFELRCGRQEYRLSQYLLMRADEVVGSEARAVGRATRPSDWTVAAPDTVAEGMILSVCSAAETVAAG